MDVGSKRKSPTADSAAVAGLSLSLSPEETALFDLLLEVVAARGLPCILRVAGGWVRDKIMGLEAHDIDIAIDDRMGKAFAEELSAYMKEVGREKEVGSVGVIKSNPEQSKHLETATMRVLGFEIDFVNLRAEEYTDSRIPVMRIGTAYEDSMRRDLTINALFYNINNKAVEDFTGFGMDDIRAKVVRTPLPPLQTMIDDPLRALRAVRFATRFDFVMDSELQTTLRSAEVAEALANKVSKERVLTELNGMLLGPRPADAIRHLHSFSLLPIVFSAPEAPDLKAEWPSESMKIVETIAATPRPLASALLRLCDEQSEGKENGFDCLTREWRRLITLSAVLVPLRDVTIQSGKKPLPLPEHVIRVSLKGTIKDAQETALLLDASAELKTFLTSNSQDQDELEQKVKAGYCLRKAGELWRLSLLLARSEAVAGHPGTEGTGVEEIDQRHRDLEAQIIDKWALDDCWKLKPLLTGNEVSEILGLDKKNKEDGIKIGVAMKDMMGFMLRQPRPLETTRQEAVSWLQSTFK